MSYRYPNTSYSYPRLRTTRVSGYWRCYWCDSMQGYWWKDSQARKAEFSKKHICEDCYVAYRKRVARDRKERRDRIIRADDREAGRLHEWHLKQILWERRPQPWRDFNRRKLVRILENMIRAIQDEWEREALAGYIALGMEVSK